VLGHVLRREKTETVSMTKNTNVNGKRGRRRPKRDGLKLECDMRMTGVCEEDAKDRSK